MSLLKFESMLKTNNIYYFDSIEFEKIIIHYLNIGKHSLAKKAIKLGLEQHPDSVELQLLQTEVYIFDNEIDKASKLLQKATALDPSNEEIFIQKASIDSKKGLHHEAIANLQKALSLTQEKLDIWSLIGMEYMYIDDFKNAQLLFMKCIDTDIEDYTALYNIIYCFEADENYQQAIDYLNSYIDKNPYSEIAWHQLGRLYFTLKMYKDAVASFDYAILIDEYFIGGYLEKAKTLEHLKQYQEAIDNYLITLELDDPTAFVYLRIGECYKKLKNNKTAIFYYKKAIHEDPLLDKAWMLLADLHYIKKDNLKALYCISESLKIDDTNTLYWRKYSEISIQLSYFEEAASGLEKCLALEDTAIEIYMSLTDILSFLGDYKDALNILFKAKKSYTDFAEIEYRLAGIFFLLNKKKYAFSHLKNAMKINFKTLTILNELFPTIFKDTQVQKIILNYTK